MTPTPRTDAIAHRGYNESAYIAEMTDMARQLERELAEARENEIQHVLSRAKAINDLREQLAAERELAVRLADAVTDLRQLLRAHGQGCGTGREALAAWKEARSGTV